MALTDDEQKELDSLELQQLEDEKSKAAPQVPKGNSLSDRVLQAQIANVNAFKPMLPYLAYPSKLMNTGLAMAAGIGKTALGMNKKPGQSYWESLSNPNVVTPEEAKLAVDTVQSPNSPTLEDYANRLNVPKGPATPDWLLSEPGSGGLRKLNLPERGGPLDTNLRDAGLKVLSAITDPVNKFFPNVAGKATTAAGDVAYKSAFKLPDAAALEAKAAPLSGFAMSGSARPIMNPEAIALYNAKLGRNAVNTMREIPARAEALGAPMVSTERALGPALDEARALGENSFTAAPAKSLEQQVLDQWGNGTEIPLQQTYDISKMAGKNASWAGRSGDLPKSQVLQKLRHGSEGGFQEAVAEASPELADQYARAKQAVQTSLASEPVLKREIGKAVRKNNLTEVKGALAGEAMRAAQEPSSWFPLMAMYASKAWNTPTGRTAMGSLLNKVGANVPIDALLRQEYLKSQLSPWQQINNNQQEE